VKTFDPNTGHGFSSGFRHDTSLVEVSNEALLPLALNFDAHEHIERPLPKFGEMSN
jgi:hypothetical protein